MFLNIIPEKLSKTFCYTPVNQVYKNFINMQKLSKTKILYRMPDKKVCGDDKFFVYSHL